MDSGYIKTLLMYRQWLYLDIGYVRTVVISRHGYVWTVVISDIVYVWTVAISDIVYVWTVVISRHCL